MDKGKVFRNLAKKKLAEYVIEKEQKGEQEPFSETVAQPKGVIQKSEQRKKYDIDLEFAVGNKKVPVKLNVNLSIPERRKFTNYTKYISNAVKLKNSAVLVERLNNLLKRIVAEKDNYSIDFSNAMKNLIKALNEKLNEIVQGVSGKEGLEGVRNVFNQLNEIFDERINELTQIEEGEPASSVSVVTKTKEGVPIVTPQEQKTEEITIPIGEETKTKTIRVKQPKKRNLPNPTVTGSRNAQLRQQYISKARNLYDTSFKKVETIENKNRLYELLNTFILRIANNDTITKEKLKDDFTEIESEINDELKTPEVSNIYSSLAQPAAAEEEEESSGNGKPLLPRKGRHNTYRGYIGYGESIPAVQKAPSVGVVGKRGFAANPSAANSAFGQPAWSQQQYDSIGKYLNFNLVPNKHGNYAVLEN